MDFKSVCRYELELKSILRSIKNSYKNPRDFSFKKSEQVLMKKIDELEKAYKQTNQKEYKNISRKTLKKYNEIIKRGLVSHPEFVPLSTLPESKYFHLNSEEAKRRRIASLEIAVMNYEDSGRNAKRFF